MTKSAPASMDAREGLSTSRDLSKDARESLIRDWVRRRLGRIDHELRVARLAGHFFDLTQRWHKLPPADRRLLTLGALVHDVGRAVEDRHHAQHGARMIGAAGHLPLGDAERRRVAYLTRYHRGRVPDAGGEEFLDPKSDAGEILKMRTLLGLLRASDALDSRSLPAPQLVLALRERKLIIRGYVSGSAQEAADTFGRPKKFRLLEETLECEIRTEWFSTERVSLVA